MKNNEWKITVIEYGVFANTPRGQNIYLSHWGKNGADVLTDNSANVTLVQGHGHNIIFDTGYYDEVRFARDGGAGVLRAGEYLAEVGLKPEDIDTVILSHLHYDHCDNVDLFPNAKVYVGRAEYEGWIQACATIPRHHKVVFVYFEERVMEKLRKIEKEGRLVLVDDGEEIYPGISVHLAAGHSFGDQVLAVNTEDGVFVSTQDAAYTLENVETMTPMGYGLSQVGMCNAFDVIRRLVNDNWHHVIPGHDIDTFQKYRSTVFMKDGVHRLTYLPDKPL